MTSVMLWVLSRTDAVSMVRIPTPLDTRVLLMPLCIVAVTRAQALLIVVGNSNVLGLDPLWRRFLNVIALGGGWRGSAAEDGTLGPSWDVNAEVHDEDTANWLTEMREKGIEELREIMEKMGVQDNEIGHPDNAQSVPAE
jgi:hypothetical protein